MSSDDIVTRLREAEWYCNKSEEHMGYCNRKCARRHLPNPDECHKAADEIERLRARLLGEENAYDILRLENERLHNGGCARDQHTTQFCAEAAETEASAMKLRAQLFGVSEELTRARMERDDARRRVCELLVRSGGVFRRVGRHNVECSTVEEIAEISGWDCFKEAKA